MGYITTGLNARLPSRRTVLALGGGGPLARYAADNGALPTVMVYDFKRALLFTNTERGDLTSDDYTYANTSGGVLEMVDSDGATKAQPHNFLLQSSDLTSNWLTGGSLTIDGEDQVTYTAATADNLRQFVTPPVGPTYTYSLDIWSTTDAGEQVQAQLFVTGVPNGLLDVTLASEATRVSLGTETDGGTEITLFRIQNNVDGLAKVVHVDNLCLYKSPMVLNPDTGSDLVPTTTAIAYMARNGHYVDSQRAGLLFDTTDETMSLDEVPNGTYDIQVVENDGTVNTHLAEAVSGGYDLADTGVVSHVAFFPQGALV
jgi:hypothetical protein